MSEPNYKSPTPSLQPVAHVSQLGTGYCDPSLDPPVEGHHALVGENLSRIMSSGNGDDATESEVGQGDAARRSPTHRRRPESPPKSPTASPRLPVQTTSPIPPDEARGAVGGVPFQETTPPRTAGGSSRVPLLRIPDEGSFQRSLTPMFDRPLSPPVAVAEVEDQASFIIQGFFEERWRQESGNDAPSELVLPADPSSQTRHLGGVADDDVYDGSHHHPMDDSSLNPRRQMLSPDDARRSVSQSPTHDKKFKAVSVKLNMIAEDIDRRYSKELDEMIDMLKLNASTAYAAFAEIANHFLTGGISWSRIIALLVFGYRMARTVINRAVPNFLQKIVSYLAKFICKHVAKWIADRGGWLAILNLEEGISWTGVFGIMSIAFGALATLSWLRKGG